MRIGLCMYELVPDKDFNGSWHWEDGSATVMDGMPLLDFSQLMFRVRSNHKYLVSYNSLWSFELLTHSE